MIIEVQTDANITYGYDRYEDILLKSEDGGTWHYISCNGKPVYSDYERKLLDVGRELDKEIQELWVQREIELHNDPDYQEYLYQQWLEHEEQQRQLEIEEKNFKLGFEQKKRELIKMGFNDDEIKLIENKFIESMEFCNLEEYVVDEVEKYIQELITKCGNVAPILPEAIQDNTVFPVDALPSTIQKFVKHTAETSGQDVEFFALPSLVTVATAIGTAREVAINNDYKTLPIIYALLIANPGSGKSPAQKQATEPLSKLQKDEYNQYIEQCKQYQKDLETYESEKKKARSNKEECTLECPMPPKLKEYYTTNATIEGMAKMLQNNSRGIMAKQDEFEGFYNSLNGYRAGIGGDLQQWLEMWNGSEIKIDRKGQETTYIPQSYCSIIGNLTPSGIGRIAGNANTENGFLDRFLISFPTSNKKFNISDKSIPEDVKNGYHSLIKSLTELKKAKDNRIFLSKKAREIYDTYCLKLDEIAGDDEKLDSIHAKLKMYSVRLALIIHVCEEVELTFHHSEIQEESMQKAVQLCEYFRGQADKIYDKLSTSESDEMVERAIRVIKKKAKQDGENFIITKREIQRGTRIKAEQMNTLATDLIERQIISIKEEGKQGSVTYYVNPNIMQ